MFTQQQLKSLDAAERISSIFSLMGASFIIVTFIFTNRFRRPINRLAFYAAFGNVCSNIATLIARDGIIHLNGRRTSALCNFQALFIQVFLPADAIMCLCMAINVYLTVIHKYSAADLRKLEPLYIIASYATPFFLGFVLLFINSPSKGPVYGSATLWCWISTKWDVLRIAAFYAPVWVVIAVTLVLYILAGRVIFRLRHSLRQFAAEQKSQRAQGINSSTSDLNANAARKGISQPPNVIQMTTVTQVDVSSPRGPPISYKGDAGLNPGMINDYSYTVTVETAGTPTEEREDEFDEIDDVEDQEVETHHCNTKAVQHVDIEKRARTGSDATKRASQRARNTLKANAAAFAYARCAFLFFAGLLITWIPSSMNRVYSFVHKDQTVFAFSLLSALVLPAQGLWNGIIYICTSWSSCKTMWKDITFHFSCVGSDMASVQTNSTSEKKASVASSFD